MGTFSFVPPSVSESFSPENIDILFRRLSFVVAGAAKAFARAKDETGANKNADANRAAAAQTNGGERSLFVIVVRVCCCVGVFVLFVVWRVGGLRALLAACGRSYCTDDGQNFEKRNNETCLADGRASWSTLGHSCCIDCTNVGPK